MKSKPKKPKRIVIDQVEENPSLNVKEAKDGVFIEQVWKGDENPVATIYVHHTSLEVLVHSLRMMAQKPGEGK
jgi:hypothetical protein